MKRKIDRIIAIVMLLTYVSCVYATDFGSPDVIMEVQKALNAAGFDCGTPDGVAGNMTAQAISNYRASVGLPEGTGIDEALYNSLLGTTVIAEESIIEETQATSIQVIDDDECVNNILVKYAGSLAKLSYNQIKADLDALGYEYETTIGADDLATFNLVCQDGGMYICCYPLGYNESDFGNPDKEMLSILEYKRGDKWISVSDSMHINGGVLNTGDRSREQVNKEVSSLDALIEFYNSEMGGSLTLTNKEVTAVKTDSDRKSEVEKTVKSRASDKYTLTSVDRVEVNSNAGTSAHDDFIVLIYLTWDQKNSVSTSQTMLEMFSDDMAATLAGSYTDASEITLFWEVPYLLSSGTCAKYSYSCTNGGAYRIETFGPLYN